MLSGVEQIAQAVKVTLGPCGRLVMLDKKFGAPTITKDGVSVAKEVELKDPFENMGAQLVKEVASKTNDVAGDGTTTATVLAYAIVREGLKSVSAGMTPIEIKRGIDKATAVAVEAIKKNSRAVKGSEDITHVATISANNDPEIGKILADAIEKVGKDGVITVEESKNMDTTVKTVEGMQFDRGYISSYFVTDRERMEVNYSDAFVLIHDKKISTMKHFFATFWALFLYLMAIAQTDLPQVFSPNAAELGKYGKIPVSYFNGLPNISIPLTELRAKNYTLSVYLTYHAGGNKPDQHPGWVGLGWTLHAGG